MQYLDNGVQAESVGVVAHVQVVLVPDAHVYSGGGEREARLSCVYHTQFLRIIQWLTSTCEIVCRSTHSTLTPTPSIQ